MHSLHLKGKKNGLPQARNLTQKKKTFARTLQPLFFLGGCVFLTASCHKEAESIPYPTQKEKEEVRRQLAADKAAMPDSLAEEKARRLSKKGQDLEQKGNTLWQDAFGRDRSKDAP